MPKGGKRKRSAKQEDQAAPQDVPAPSHPKAARMQGAKADRGRWTNRQRTLVFSSRGISYRVRHLLNDLRVLMPHSKKDAKMDRKDKIAEVIPEICELKNCNNCVYIEMRKKKDVYMWLSKVPHGPSAKFLVQNLHTMDELKLTGNHLKGSRPLLSFDEQFDSTPMYKLLKEVLFQTFATPEAHPKSKPFVDHVFSFTILDGRIWFRNYQIAWEEKGKLGRGAKDVDPETNLIEVGPRFTLCPIRVFEGTFGGPTLYENPDYVSPNVHRRNLKLEAAAKFRGRQQARDDHVRHTASLVLPEDPIAEVFDHANAAAREAGKN